MNTCSNTFNLSVKQVYLPTTDQNFTFHKRIDVQGVTVILRGLFSLTFKNKNLYSNLISDRLSFISESEPLQR